MLKIYKKADGKKLIHESYDKLLKEWHVDITEKFVETIYGTTHIVITGEKEKPSLLLLHGVGDDVALMWICNAKALAEHFYIIAVDNIGGPGRSEPNDKYDKNFNQAKWIDQILDEMHIDKVNIAGVSYGAYLAQYYAIKRPERVIKAVCMAGSAALKTRSASTLKNMLVFLPEALFPTKRNTNRLIKKLCGDNHKVFTENKRIMEHWLYLLKYFNNMAMRFHRIELFSHEEVATLKNRVLFIIGDRDPIAYSLKAVEILKDMELDYRILKNTGHGINHEEADIVNKEIINFLL